MNNCWTIVFLFAASLLTVGSVTKAIAQQDWWQRAKNGNTTYYAVTTDLPEDQRQEICSHMDRVYESYVGLFAGLKLRRKARLDVYLFATQQDYLTILRRRFDADGTGSAGMCITYRGVISLVAWKGDQSIERMKDVLQHEGFHQFAAHFFPGLPSWANEGLAEIFERGVLVDGKIVVGEVSQNDHRQLVEAKAKSQFKEIGAILTMDGKEWNHQVKTGNAAQNYLQSWSLVHCFLYAENARYQKQFLRFLKAINEGMEWKRAFVTEFGIPDPAAMNQIWLGYVDSLQPMDYMETIRRFQFLAAGYMKLREDGNHVVSIAELQQELGAIDFVFESELFEKKKSLAAGDDEVFRVPFANDWTKTPVFEMVDSKGKKPEIENKSGKARAKKPPKPLVIRTQHFSPQNFYVTWKRDRKSPGGYRPVFVAQ